MKKNMNQRELKNAGYQVLAQNLGPDGMIRFLQDIEIGSDDYSKTRHKSLDKYSVDDIYNEIMDTK